MPSKKTQKPLFEIPIDIQSAPQSGWVYRSDPEGRAVPQIAPAELNGLVEAGALTMALGLATMGQAMVLGLRILSIPWSAGVQSFNSLTR